MGCCGGSDVFGDGFAAAPTGTQALPMGVVGGGGIVVPDGHVATKIVIDVRGRLLLRAPSDLSPDDHVVLRAAFRRADSGALHMDIDWCAFQRLQLPATVVVGVNSRTLPARLVLAPLSWDGAGYAIGPTWTELAPERL